MIIRLRKLWFTISGIMFFGSLAVILFWGLPLGIDFTGGNVAEITTNLQPEQVKEQLQNNNITAQTQATESGGVLIKFKLEDQTVPSQSFLNDALGGQGSIVRFEAVGPAISQSLQQKALIAITVSSLAIIIYLAWAFKSVGHILSSWSFGIIAVIALIHDLIIMTGVFAIVGHSVASISIDSYFITALLTIMGYSVNDTIVIFDRIRENLHRHKGNLSETISMSVTQTLSRSLNTSTTVLLVLIPLIALGSGTLLSFLLALTIGVVVGTYSSIFIAAPLLVSWYTRKG